MKRRRIEITAIRRTAVVLCNQPAAGPCNEPRPVNRAPEQDDIASARLGALMPAEAAPSSEPALLIDVLVKNDAPADLGGEHADPDRSGNYTRLLSLGISVRDLVGGKQP